MADNMADQLKERYYNDPEFAAALKADPKAALAAALGADIPAEVNITVLEESATQRYIVIPEGSGKVSLDELDSVSGGGWA